VCPCKDLPPFFCYCSVEHIFTITQQHFSSRLQVICGVFGSDATSKQLANTRISKRISLSTSLPKVEVYATLNVSATTTITKLSLSAFIAHLQGFLEGNVNDVTM
jgi:hypothetical protein